MLLKQHSVLMCMCVCHYLYQKNYLRTRNCVLFFYSGTSEKLLQISSVILKQNGEHSKHRNITFLDCRKRETFIIVRLRNIFSNCGHHLKTKWRRLGVQILVIFSGLKSWRKKRRLYHTSQSAV